MVPQPGNHAHYTIAWGGVGLRPVTSPICLKNVPRASVRIRHLGARTDGSSGRPASQNRTQPLIRASPGDECEFISIYLLYLLLVLSCFIIYHSGCGIQSELFQRKWLAAVSRVVLTALCYVVSVVYSHYNIL